MHRAYLHVLADADRILAIPHVDTIFHCATAGYYGLLLDGKCPKRLHALEDGTTVELPAIQFKLDSELGECTQAKASGRRRGRKGRGSGRGRGRSADTTALVTIPKGPKNLKLKLKHKSKKKKPSAGVEICPDDPVLPIPSSSGDVDGGHTGAGGGEEHDGGSGKSNDGSGEGKASATSSSSSSSSTSSNRSDGGDSSSSNSKSDSSGPKSTPVAKKPKLTAEPKKKAAKKGKDKHPKSFEWQGHWFTYRPMTAKKIIPQWQATCGVVSF